MVWQGRYDKLFIGGSWVDPASPETISVFSPYTEQEIARVAKGSVADADRAVAAARAAFDQGPWPRMQLQERMDVLRRWSAQMQELELDVAALVTDEMGCPISLSRVMQSRNPRILIDSFLDFAPDYEWSAVRRSGSGQALVTRDPIGVVAAITPWNAPLLSVIIKAVPALLAGCTMVVKPSSEAPLSSYLLAEMLQASGLPEGVVNILPAGRDVGEHLVRHHDVDKVSFTGSTEAGRRIAALCGGDLRRVTLELGGKSAAVILDDADLDVVVDSIRTTSLRNNGQACSNKTRILVSSQLESELKDRLVAMVESIPVGDPADPATQIGPLVAERQRTSVEGYIAAGKDEGAKVLVGGGRPAGLDHGWFVEPTVFTDVHSSMRIAQEEIFGPVLTVQSYRDEDEAVAIANDSSYGLSGSVFSTDGSHALSLARRIRTGTVELNGKPVGWHAPVGGVKCSGLGREAGPEGFDAYVELKSYGLSTDLAETLT
jgi:acyl-CoA reductase-like NAD-dependent aldehyde dehydrogenase